MAEFFSMDGYGFYIWGSYLSALVLFAAEVALLVKRKNVLKRQASAIAGKQSVNHSPDNSYEASS